MDYKEALLKQADVLKNSSYGEYLVRVMGDYNEVVKTKLKDCVIEPEVYGDERGFFWRPFK